MRILQVGNSDLLKLAEIEKELFKEDAFGVFLLLHYLQSNILFQKLVDDNNDMIGFGIITRFIPELLNPHETAFIKHLQNQELQVAHLVDFAIRINYWGYGYGTSLLKHFVKSLMSKQYGYLYLEVNSSNTRAIRFYNKHSFREIGFIKSYYSTGQDAILMLKKLE